MTCFVSWVPGAPAPQAEKVAKNGDAGKKLSWQRKSEDIHKGKQQRRVKTRSLLCFWAVSELGMSLRELARRLEMRSHGVWFSFER